QACDATVDTADLVDDWDAAAAGTDHVRTPSIRSRQKGRAMVSATGSPLASAQPTAGCSRTTVDASVTAASVAEHVRLAPCASTATPIDGAGIGSSNTTSSRPAAAMRTRPRVVCFTG